MIRFISAIFLLLSIACFGQKMPSKEEMARMMKQAQEMAKNAQADPRFQKAIQEEENVDDEGVHWGKLPSKNSAKLALIPKEILTKDKLQLFVADIYNHLLKHITGDNKEAAKALVQNANNDPLLISRAAIAAWYKKNSQLALLLASESAKANAGTEVLNTLSALLNLNGFEHKAIPILLYLNQHLPGNSTVLNNLGQAYLGLGDSQSAENYLKQCIARSSRHVEANKSLGMIYQANGNLAQAKACFLRSLQGGYSPTAASGAGRSGSSEEEIGSTVLNKNAPVHEVFNSYKYKIPPLCENVSEAPKADRGHKDFREYLDEMRRKYEALARDADKDQKKNMDDLISGAMRAPVMEGPLLKKGRRMYKYWMTKFTTFTEKEYAPDMIRFSKASDALKEQYDKALAKANTGSPGACKIQDQLENELMAKHAILQRDYMQRILTPSRGYAQELTYWSQFAIGHGIGRGLPYGYIGGYLGMLKELSGLTLIRYTHCPEERNEPVPNPVTDDPKDLNCPFKVVIPLVIGKISLSCESYDIELGEGIIINYSGDWSGHESTLAIGTGLEIELPCLDLGAKEQFYVTFDENNIPSDIGLSMEAGAESTISGLQIESKSGYTLGLNSGWNFQTGAFGRSTNWLD